MGLLDILGFGWSKRVAKLRRRFDRLREKVDLVKDDTLRMQCLQILDGAERTLEIMEETPKEQLGHDRAAYIGQVTSAISQVEEILKESKRKEKAPPLPQAGAGYPSYPAAPAPPAGY